MGPARAVTMVRVGVVAIMVESFWRLGTTVPKNEKVRPSIRTRIDHPRI